jgi:hypothetical protein|tara:strand:+ start:126 stop:362 length:237 start_codon:yes stop_codon:yes gene_type:complete
MSSVENALSETINILGSLERGSRHQVLAAVNAFYEKEIDDEKWVKLPVLNEKQFLQKIEDEKKEIDNKKHNVLVGEEL